VTAGTPELRLASEEKRAANRERIRRARTRRRLTMWGVRLASLAIVLGVWQWYGSSVNPILFAPPTKIAHAFVMLVRDGTLGRALVQSLTVFGIGMGAAIAVAIPLALVWARYQVVDWAIQGYVNALYATPLVAIIPLVILWFGLGNAAKLFIVTILAVFPILINTISGVHNVPANFIELGSAFAAREREVFVKIILPSALPYMMTGLRLGIGRAIIGMVVAEFFTAITGLGALIVKYGNQYDTASMFVPILVLMLLGVTLSVAVRRAEKWIAPWRYTED